jgi:antitoxin HicB
MNNLHGGTFIWFASLLHIAMGKKYKVIIEPGEDGWLVVTVPALPGCITQGREIEEALKNAKEAIEAYLEALEKDNQPIPEPDIVSIQEVAVSV